MDPTLELVLALAAGLTIGPRAYRAMVVRWAVWMWKWWGFDVEYGPVGVRCYGTEPCRTYRDARGHYGALAIIADQLAFASLSYGSFSIPITAMRWIGYVRTTVQGLKYPRDIDALIIHCEEGEDWQVYAFGPDSTWGIAQELSERCRLDIVQMGRNRESYGPHTTTCMKQDIYGEWHSSWWGQLYLAPDRLPFAPPGPWNKNPLLLLAVREVTVLKKGGLLHKLNPLSEDLLRIEYWSVAEGKPHVVGFLVHDAEAWAAAIQRLGVANVTVQTGRKKKGGEDESEEGVVADLISKIRSM